MTSQVLSFLGMMLPAVVGALAQAVEVPNPSFEEGTDSPKGWTLEGGKGQWLKEGAADGQRAIAVTGAGDDSGYWRSSPLGLKSSTIYRLRFQARNIDGRGGTPTTGPPFCNVDLGHISDRWQPYESHFVTPADPPEAGRPDEMRPDQAYLRFGQWHVNGTVAFDGIDLKPAQPTYVTQGDLVLGEGESVQGRQYGFQAPLGGSSRNHSRPLERHRCGFNSNRWVFGAGSEVIYRHHVGARKQTSATVDVSVTWYASGELLIEAGTDGKSWRELGVIGQQGARAFEIPKEMLPAGEVWIRLRARARKEVGKDSDPGSLQVGAYGYRAVIDGEAADLVGGTRFFAIEDSDPRLKVTIEGVGEALPGGSNALVATVRNLTDQRTEISPEVAVRDEAGKRRTPAQGAGSPSGTPAGGGEAVRFPYELPGSGRLSVTIPYELPGSGRWKLTLSLGQKVKFRAETSIRVPEFHDASYGEQLPGSSEKVGLWWASSGWKISRTRPLPKATGKELLIRAARNEAEAAQLVVRPGSALRGLTAKGAALSGPNGAVIPAENLEVLRVRYVTVSRPTDSTGVVAPWPDPLPPFKGPIDVPANTNQPLWVRVKVPANAAAGEYTGSVHLTGEGFSADVPLRVEVYDFALPDRMTCQTSFGFSPENVWRYQRIRDPNQRRAVLEKYLADFGAHHISPYDPAPMDRFRVAWSGTGDWEGGTRDPNEKHTGKSSLLVKDDSKTSQVSAQYVPQISIPPKGLRLKFWYRTAQAGHKFIVALNHHEAAGTWMSGRNINVELQGEERWQGFDRTITKFPSGAASVALTLYAAVWAEDGSTTGAVWYDDLCVQDAGTGAELVKGGDFEPLDPAALRADIEWTAWDAAMKRAIEEYHFNSFMVPVVGMGGGSFHARFEPSLLGYPEDSPEYKAAFTAYCQAVQEHLRQKGWLKEAYVYWFDEPDEKDYPFVMNGFRKLKQAAPDLTRMLTEQVEPALIGGPNLWCPVTPNYNHDAAEKRRQAGERFWWYVCTGPKAPYCTLFIDHPATELRVWLWQTWQRKIDGILVWQTNYWTSGAAYPEPNQPQNPYEDPMGWVSGYGAPKGARNPWGNGDGRFIYPPEAAADGRQDEAVLDGPVDSIRWEMLRDGIEDYEYLAILRSLLEKNKDKLSPDERKRYAELLEVPKEITADMTTFTTNSAAIERRRDEIARAIEKLR